jgi:hypothetical protein
MRLVRLGYPRNRVVDRGPLVYRVPERNQYVAFGVPNNGVGIPTGIDFEEGLESDEISR